MPFVHKFLPVILIVAGLLGIGLFVMARHWQMIPTFSNDFTQGLWCGVCLGFEILGGMILFKRKAKRAA